MYARQSSWVISLSKWTIPAAFNSSFSLGELTVLNPTRARKRNCGPACISTNVQSCMIIYSFCNSFSINAGGHHPFSGACLQTLLLIFHCKEWARNDSQQVSPQMGTGMRRASIKAQQTVRLRGFSFFSPPWAQSRWDHKNFHRPRPGKRSKGLWEWRVCGSQDITNGQVTTSSVRTFLWRWEHYSLLSDLGSIRLHDQPCQCSPVA